MVECDDITGSMRGDGENDPVSEFIGKIIKNYFLPLYCTSNYIDDNIICYSSLQSKIYGCVIDIN